MGAHRQGRRSEVGARALTPPSSSGVDQGRLLDVDTAASPDDTPHPARVGRVVRVLPDVAAIDKVFDYVVPEEWHHDGRADGVVVGAMVRIDLHGRRVGGWIVEVDVVPPPGVTLVSLAKVTGYGPSAEMVELCRWIAHRWSGRLARVLVSASPPRAVPELPAPRETAPAASSIGAGLAKAFDKDRAVVRLPPGADPFPVVQEAAGRGNALVVAPTLDAARVVGARLRRTGVPVAVMPRDWDDALRGATVVGARSVVLAPVHDLAAVVVLDEHDETLQEERNPTWHARDVALERAARAGVPCVLVSPIPSLQALEAAPLLRPGRAAERQGWPVVQVIDRREDDPVRGGLLSGELTSVLRDEGPVVCVLNRKGRSRRLACARCGTVAWHESCSVPFVQNDGGALECPSCGEQRPLVCEACGSTGFKNLRAGITRVREELEALARRPVVEVSGDDDGEGADLVVGTEAVLHRVRSARAVVFLDFDQELLARRYRATEQAMALLVLAARLVGDRDGAGRIVVQTRVPDHEVIEAALRADPGRVAEAERTRRTQLRLPPYVGMAEISGAGADAFAESLRVDGGAEVLGPVDGRFLVKADDPNALADVLERVPRPTGRVRVAVDPPRV